MASIIKVNDIQNTSGANIINESSNTITIGASGDNIIIPSGATITNNGTASGFGKIGQVVSTTKSDTDTVSATSFTNVSGLSASITPTSTSSKILVQIVMYCGVNATNLDFGCRLARDGTAIGYGDSAGNRTPMTASLGEDADYSAYSMRPIVINYLDSPSSTSSLSYTIQLKVASTNSIYVNRTSNDSDGVGFPRTISTFTLMEVLA